MDTNVTKNETGTVDTVFDLEFAVEGAYARTNDIETYYVRYGEGPPIVFIHGMFMDHRMWGPQLDALNDEFTTVAYDVRGHGLTGGSDHEEYSMALYVDDLHALLAALDIERPVLCGLSMGGCIVQAYAATHPEDVAGLVLADTFAPEPMDLTGRLAFANLRFFGLLDNVVSYKRLNRLQLWVGNRLKPGVGGDEETVQKLVDDGPTISHEEFVKIIGSMVEFPGSDIDLSVIDVPTLVLHGEHLPSFMRRQGPAIEAAIPDATRREVPGGGHASNIDNPAFFTDAVRDLARAVD